jgi:hypothetical protein
MKRLQPVLVAALCIFGCAFAGAILFPLLLWAADDLASHGRNGRSFLVDAEPWLSQSFGWRVDPLAHGISLLFFSLLFFSLIAGSS